MRYKTPKTLDLLLKNGPCDVRLKTDPKQAFNLGFFQEELVSRPDRKSAPKMGRFFYALSCDVYLKLMTSELLTLSNNRH